MRDRINMLIKQKLDDRGKGKLVHLKRDVNNIQYYDYDSDANGKEPEADSNVVQNDQRRGCQANSTDPEGLEPPSIYIFIFHLNSVFSCYR